MSQTIFTAKALLLAGNDGVGKSTFAANLVDVPGRERVIMSFADPLRASIAGLCNIHCDSLKNQDVKASIVPNTNMTYRALMISIATIVREKANNDFFVKILIDRVIGTKKTVIIDDMRFHVEFETVSNDLGRSNVHTILLTKDNEPYLGEIPRESFDFIINRVASDGSNKIVLIKHPYM